MRKLYRAFLVVAIFGLLLPAVSSADGLTFKEIQARISQYKAWLDELGSNGAHYWMRLDSSKRPHRLYVGEGFMQANPGQREQFVEIFSRYLAGHPEKNMLIDIFDDATGNEIGEYGFGGFRLFTPASTGSR
jgi:hypothetical protein